MSSPLDLKSALGARKNDDDKAFKNLDVTYSSVEQETMKDDLDTDLALDETLDWNSNDTSNYVSGILKEKGGIIDIMLEEEGFEGKTLSKELKDLLAKEALSFGSVDIGGGNTKPENLEEVIKNLLSILERYDDNAKDETFGDVVHDETLGEDESLSNYFTDKNFKATTGSKKAFADNNFEYTQKGKGSDLSEIKVIFGTENIDNKYDASKDKENIKESINKMADGYEIDDAMMEKLIKEGLSLHTTKDLLTNAKLLENIAKVLERYDNNEKDEDYGNVDSDKTIKDGTKVKDTDQFLKNTLSDKNLKNGRGQAFSKTDFKYDDSDKKEIKKVYGQGILSQILNDKSDPQAKVINNSIDKMTDGFKLSDEVKKALIAEAKEMKPAPKNIGKLLDNIAQVLERYDSKADKKNGDVANDKAIDTKLQNGFNRLLSAQGVPQDASAKPFSKVAFDFDKKANEMINKNNENAILNGTNVDFGDTYILVPTKPGAPGKTKQDAFLKEGIKDMLEAAGVTTVPDELLSTILKEASTLADPTKGRLTIADMLKNAAKVIERYDNNTDTIAGDTGNNSALTSENALNQYFADKSFVATKGANIEQAFSDIDFEYSAVDKAAVAEILRGQTPTISGGKLTDAQNTAMMSVIDRMVTEEGFAIDPAIKKQLIAQAIVDAPIPKNLSELTNNIERILEKKDTERDIDLQKDLRAKFENTNFVYDADLQDKAEGALKDSKGQVHKADDDLDRNDAVKQEKQREALRAGIDAMVASLGLTIDLATKDQLINEALSFVSPFEPIKLKEILANVAVVIDDYDNDNAVDARGAVIEEEVVVYVDDVLDEEEVEEVEDVLTWKEESKLIDAFAGVNFDDGIVSDTFEDQQYNAKSTPQHNQIFNAVKDIIENGGVKIEDIGLDVVQLLITKAAQMTDSNGGRFTVGDVLDNVKKLIEYSDEPQE